MINRLKTPMSWALSITAVLFTFIPNPVLPWVSCIFNISEDAHLVLNRVVCFLAVFSLAFLYYSLRRSVSIKGHNYTIQVQYKDLFRMRKCKKVIPFDECFTTHVGSAPEDINPDSICGQYLNRNPMSHNYMVSLLEAARLEPMAGLSDYQGKRKYPSGKLVPNSDYLLMSFAKLNSDGLGEMTRKEFLECLSVLWDEINKYYGQVDVCIPILGSGVTRMEGNTLTQQELLDIIIESYKLSTCKIKTPCKLHIVCRERDDFSLNRIGTTL